MVDLLNSQPYLQTEARIIAENATHIEIAVRLEIALISRHLPLMAALADISTLGVKDT